MSFHWLSLRQRVVTINPGFINGFLTEIVLLTVLVRLCTDVLSGCDSEHIRHPPCAALSATRFSDDGHNHQVSNSYCNAQFTCDAAVILNQRINLVFGLRRRFCGWSVAARPVTALKAIDQRLS
jgi:hypothetical protein